MCCFVGKNAKVSGYPAYIDFMPFLVTHDRIFGSVILHGHHVELCLHIEKKLVDQKQNHITGIDIVEVRISELWKTPNPHYGIFSSG